MIIYLVILLLAPCIITVTFHEQHVTAGAWRGLPASLGDKQLAVDGTASASHS